MKIKKASKIMTLVFAVAVIIAFLPSMVSAATINPTTGITGVTSDFETTTTNLVTFEVNYQMVGTVGTDQVTLLVTEGSADITYDATNQPSNIKYIDQVDYSTTGKFTFVADKPTVTSTYYVKVGGTDITAPASNSADPAVLTVTSRGFTVSGTVTPVAYIEGFDDLNTATAVTLNLKTSYLGAVVKTLTANNQTGEFSFVDVANGSYVMEVKRAGFLSRYFNVTVNNANVTGISKTLMGGDFNDDLAIDASDAGMLFEKLGSSYGDSIYAPTIDISTDYAIDASDAGIIFENLGKDITIYGEDVNWDN